MEANYIKAALLFLSFLFILLAYFNLTKVNEDVRRKRRRISFRNIGMKTQRIRRISKDDHLDRLIKRMGLPDYIKSEYINLARLFIFVFLLVLFIIQTILRTEFMSLTLILIFMGIAFLIYPYRFSPSYYLVNLLTQRHQYQKLMEIYLLYENLISEYKSKGDRAENIYHLLSQLKTSYSLINVPIEKMLPLINEGKHTDAWDKFYQEVGIDQAEYLGNVMQNVESVSIDQTLKGLLDKKEKFSSELINQYTEYLTKRKNILFSIAFAGALFTIALPSVMIYEWYNEIMTEANQNLMYLGD